MAEGIHYYASLSFEAAYRLLDALLQSAAMDGGKPVAIAVVDDRGDLVAFGRLDGTPVRSVTIAINKAYTACRARQSTADLAATLARAQRGVEVYTDPRFTTFPGGVPLTSPDGTVLGAVGISGRAPEDDEALGSRWRDIITLDTD
jgi:uncharacterized protein GlcG (DUF336 family)